jgi:hypothetical protein
MPDAEKTPKRKCNPCLIVALLVVVIGGATGGVLGWYFSSQGSWVKGTWASNFGSYMTITSDHIYQVSSWGTTVYTVHTMTNSYAIMQNPSTDAYNPSKWTKMEYHAIEDGKFGVCSTVYNGETAQAALDTDTSAIYDSTDASSGCNGFPFTEMTAYEFPIAGTYSTNYGSTLTLDAARWVSVDGNDNEATWAIEAYGNNFVLMQNAPDAAYNANKWTKVNFHTVGSGFGFCMSVYNGDTAVAAITTDTAAIYSATNATAGCNGFPHTIASPA